MKKHALVLLTLLALLLAACGMTDSYESKSSSTQASEEQTEQTEYSEEAEEAEADADAIDEDASYNTKDEVALYLHTYGHLPDNYITKDEAEDAGWKTEGLDLDEACPGMSIGGDRFGNREGLLPNAKGRVWYECDIDYNGGRSRGPKRIVYSNDGLIYYTQDHYESFEQLY